VLLYLFALVVLPAFGPPRSRIDFEIAVYYPARAFLDGVNPYDQHTYLARYPAQAPFPPFLPVTLLLHAPLGLLPPEQSGLLYMCLSLVLVFACVRLALAYAERPAGPITVMTMAALVLLSRPGRLGLRLGQLSFEPIFGTYLALYFARRQPWLAGFGLFLASIKPTFGVPLGVLMLVRRQYRPVAIACALSVSLNLLVLLALTHHSGGLAAFRDHVAATVDASRQGIIETRNPAMTSLRVDAASLLGRLRGDPLPAAAQALVGAGVLTVAAAAMWLRGARGDEDADILAGLICVAILLSGYHQAYDLSLLILPAVVLTRSPPGREPLGPGIRLLLGGLLLALGANYLSSEGVLAGFGLERGSRAWLLLTSLNAVALLLTFAAYTAALARRVRPAKATAVPG
jgi:glycosyl transferase family 87